MISASSGPGSDASAGGGGSSGTADASSGGSSAECETAASAVAAKLGGAGSSCTVTVRLSASLVIEGYAVSCGSYSKVDETSARNQVMTDTGLTFGCFPAKSLTGSTPADEFVFSEPASFTKCSCCGNGWIAAASARSGLTVFGTMLAVGGTSQPAKSYPATWQPASDLGSGCNAWTKLPPARGFDFTSIANQGAQLDTATVESALAAVWTTALPVGIAKKQNVFDVVVLRYLASFSDNSTPDYVVLVNSGLFHP